MCRQCTHTSSLTATCVKYVATIPQCSAPHSIALIRRRARSPPHTFYWCIFDQTASLLCSALWRFVLFTKTTMWKRKRDENSFKCWEKNVIQFALEANFKRSVSVFIHDENGERTNTISKRERQTIELLFIYALLYVAGVDLFKEREHFAAARKL